MATPAASVFLSLVLALVVAAYVVPASAQQLPIPKRPSGMHRGNPAAPIHLVEFADYQCPDCGVSYPVVEKVLQHYGPEKIYYTLHVFPLWLHRQAFILAEAAGVVALNAPDRYWDAAQYLFANQAQFFNSVYMNKTATDLYAQLASWMPRFGVSSSTFYKQIESDAVFAHVDADIHQALIHQIYGTPTFVINGFKAESLDQTTTFAQWTAFIDSLLSTRTAEDAAAVPLSA